MREQSPDPALDTALDTALDLAQKCPCGRGDTYGACCAPLHAGEAAPTAERLMRSRYAAFALGLVPYLERSWHASTRPDDLELDPEVVWRRLLIEHVEAGSPFDQEGFVTFAAIGRGPDGRFEQRERSRFVRDKAGRWVYLDGDAVFE
ncbi:SEC-C motif-containing protein [Leucobacter exalbidus]|uniref:SEC-C motif-containing protein n=1 Tax=Leucobacter exalbidus TaxID=662960 RepID=A0A940PKP8_9MICO|nr:YchJ family metal-binding protein [Leucobacter exalbidus]MBP1324803.1 SEC-C motif-containing protein [Leucobacter exalbidus]